MYKLILFLILLSSLVVAEPLMSVEGKLSNNPEQLQGVVLTPQSENIINSEIIEDNMKFNPFVAVSIVLGIPLIGLLGYFTIKRLIR